MGSGLWEPGLGFEVYGGLGFRVYRLRALGLGFEVYGGLGFRVYRLRSLGLGFWGLRFVGAYTCYAVFVWRFLRAYEVWGLGFIWVSIYRSLGLRVLGFRVLEGLGFIRMYRT